MDIIKKEKEGTEDQYSSYESFLKNNFGAQKHEYIREKGEKNKNFGKNRLKMFLGFFSLLILFSFLIWGGYFAFKIGSVGKRVSIENENYSVIENVGSFISSLVPINRRTLKGEEEGRINIFLLGTAGKGNPGQNLTDTIMIMSIDTKNKKISLLSLPRDFYANISGTNYFTKINSIYQFGINNSEGVTPIKKTIEEISGIKMHYFIILNFDGFTKIIDDIGGINVQVERDIYDARYPGPNYSYETFEIKKGLHLLDGETALKYVRERHTDPEGDFGRAKRQQQVMQSVKNKIFSLKTLLNPISLNNLLDDLGENIKTDIRIDEIEGFIDIAQKSDTQNIINIVVDAWEKDSILKVSHIFSGGVQAFVLVPRVGNYSEIQDLTENIFDLDNIRRRKAEIEKENASITIVNQSGYPNLPGKIKDILENKIGMKNVDVEYPTSPQKTEKSIIHDISSGQKIFTLDEIIKKLRIQLSEKKNGIIEGQKNDLVLILGSDLKNIDEFEEGNIEEFKNAEEKQEYFELIKN